MATDGGPTTRVAPNALLQTVRPGRAGDKRVGRAGDKRVGRTGDKRVDRVIWTTPLGRLSGMPRRGERAPEFA